MIPVPRRPDSLAGSQPSREPRDVAGARLRPAEIEDVDSVAKADGDLCRHDALAGHWVIYAPGRNERPAEIQETVLPPESQTECPFCRGNESRTPAATLSLGDPEDEHGGWSVRVVPNLFPAVLPLAMVRPQYGRHGVAERSYEEGVAAWKEQRSPRELSYSVPRPRPIELFQTYELHGGHEVIVESPRHVESITDLSPAQAARVFEAYAQRMRYWSSAAGVQYVTVFKNVGAAAGASLRHTHSQLVATSLLPPNLERIERTTSDYFRQTGQCLLCAMLAEEMAGERIVARSARFVAYCPFASRLPFLVRIAPLVHTDRFEWEGDDALRELAWLVQQIVGRMEAIIRECSYNLTIHTRPPHHGTGESFHWWLEIFPRLTKVAGFEWGSDCFINPETPETAARQLRIPASSLQGQALERPRSPSGRD